jgi:hypothetical protein
VWILALLIVTGRSSGVNLGLLVAAYAVASRWDLVPLAVGEMWSHAFAIPHQVALIGFTAWLVLRARPRKGAMRALPGPV